MAADMKSIVNRPFPSYFEPHYESEAKCIVFHPELYMNDNYSSLVYNKNSKSDFVKRTGASMGGRASQYQRSIRLLMLLFLVPELRPARWVIEVKKLNIKYTIT